MPVHDWKRSDAGLFHHFHQAWIIHLCDALNAGGLPPGYYALAEPTTAGVVPDVLTLQHGPRRRVDEGAGAPGLAAATVPPRTRIVRQASEADLYAAKASRIVVRHRLGDVVAVVDIVSSGNTASRTALRNFVETTVDFLRQNVNLLVIDLFPPSPRDPQGIHKAIWDEIEEEPFELPPDKPLTLASYAAGPVKTAYVEPIAVGDALPDMPLFLTPDHYVPTPLEITYQTAWNACPEPLKEAVDGGRDDD